MADFRLFGTSSDSDSPDSDSSDSDNPSIDSPNSYTRTGMCLGEKSGSRKRLDRLTKRRKRDKSLKHIEGMGDLFVQHSPPLTSPATQEEKLDDPVEESPESDSPESDSLDSDDSTKTVIGPKVSKASSRRRLTSVEKARKDRLKKATRERVMQKAKDRAMELIEGVGNPFIKPVHKYASPVSEEEPDTSVGNMKTVVEHVYEIRGQESALGEPLKYRIRRPEMSPSLDGPDECVLVLRRVFTEDCQTLIDTFLDVQSPLIRRVLMETIPEEKARLESKPSFKWPSYRLFRYRGRIHDGAVSEGDLCIKHVAVLLDLIRGEYKSRLRDIDAMLPKGTVSFDILVDAFLPGDIVVDGTSDGARGYRVTNAYYTNSLPREVPGGSDTFIIEYEYIDHDGEKYGTVSNRVDIARFEGIRYLTDLALFPFQSHPTPEELRRNLLRRGFQFEDLKGHNFKAYWEPRSEAPTRVVVNTLAIRGLDRRMDIQVNDYSDKLDNGQLKIEDLMICTNRIPYFSLDEKDFFWGDPEFFEEITFVDNALDQVVFPRTTKLVLSTMAANHLRGFKFDDVIAGKGKGRVVILHGIPGVGKTMIVEAIAEHIKRPLYSIHPGELGVSSIDVERNLRRALDISTALRAVLLIDEADVYMERRVDGNMAHNATVSVFLRLLEYNQGVIFLTTSRVDSIDVAFCSRVHYSVHVENTGDSDRKEIWENFARRAGGIEIPPEELDQIAVPSISGRQIKNVLSMCKGLVPQEGNIDPQMIKDIMADLTYM